MILVPVKNLADAKQRLATVLDQPTRTELAQAMLCDVLETLGEWPDRPEVGIVTSDPFALQLAHAFRSSQSFPTTPIAAKPTPSKWRPLLRSQRN